MDNDELYQKLELEFRELEADVDRVYRRVDSMARQTEMQMGVLIEYIGAVSARDQKRVKMKKIQRTKRIDRTHQAISRERKRLMYITKLKMHLASALHS